MSHIGGNLYGVWMTDDTGRVLNAEFAVEPEGQGLSIVLESAGGITASGLTRNSNYTRALELILARLGIMESRLVDALVESRRTERLSESARRVLDRPVRLSDVDDVKALRLRLTSRQGRIGQASGARKAGNNRKRLRLRVEVPGYGVTDAAGLAAALAGGVTASSTPPASFDPELAAIPRVRPSQHVRSSFNPASSPGPMGESHGGSGYIADSVLKQALERHAVDRAAALYAGYEIEEIGKPYDLRAVKGTEQLHIEVKGSSGTADTVQLTKNEVQHAYDVKTHLVVVDQIRWSRLPNGEILTEGGRVRRWTTWTPHDEDLEVTHYRYRLPTGAELPGVADTVPDEL